MRVVIQKYSYKGISLFIKAGILICSIGYIINKLLTENFIEDIARLFPNLNSVYFYTALVLVFFNWGSEALKWQYLINKLEHISFFTSLKSVLAGITISIFTPNRVGEFAGRVFFLKNADKLQASVVSLFGSSIQLFVTVLLGIPALALINFQHPALVNNLVSGEKMLLFFTVIAFLLFIASFLLFKYKPLAEKIKSLFVFYSNHEIIYAFLFSVFRYSVFSFQYYLILKVVGIESGLISSLAMIAAIFFVTSAIPTFALTEIAVRGATAVYFFSEVSDNYTSILTASLLLWIINLALPALFGALFIPRLQFFKD